MSGPHIGPLSILLRKENPTMNKKKQPQSSIGKYLAELEKNENKSTKTAKKKESKQAENKNKKNK